MGADLAWSSIRCRTCGVEGGQPCNAVTHVEVALAELMKMFGDVSAKIDALAAQGKPRKTERERRLEKRRGKRG